MGSPENDGRKDAPQPGEVLFAPAPADPEELALTVCVALHDARHAGAEFAKALRIARPEASPEHLALVCRDVAGAAIRHNRQSIGVRSIAVDPAGLWAAIQEGFAIGAELELTGRLA